MRLLGWAVQYDCCPRKRKPGCRHVQGDNHEKEVQRAAADTEASEETSAADP